MTIKTTGLSSLSCQPQYAFSPELVCAGRITGMDITDNGTTLTISSGSAYVKVEDASGVEFMVKVYNDTAITIPKVNGTDIIVKVPISNAQNGALNTNLDAIATIESVPSGTGADFHLVLATVNGSGVVSEETNAGVYLPGCDYCMRCEGGVLQLPDVNAENITADTFTGSFVGDASGLTNINPGSINISSFTDCKTAGENITAGRAVRLGNPTIGDTSAPSSDVIQNTGGNNTNFFVNSSDCNFGQSIQSNANGVIGDVKFYIRRNSATFTPASFQLELYSDASFTTLLGTSNETISNASLTTSYVEYTFTFNNISVTNGQMLYFKSNFASFGGGTFFNQIENAGSNVYASGSAYLISTTNIPTVQSYDLRFSLEIQPYEDANKLYLSDSTIQATNTLIGFAKTTETSGTTSCFSFEGIVKGLTGLTAGQKYYLDGTSGQISTTGTGKYVGVAISNTEINTNTENEIGLTMSNFTSTNIATSSKFCTNGGFANLIIDGDTGNSPTSVIVSIQTSNNGTTWTDRVSTTHTDSNLNYHTSMSLIIPRNTYVRGNVTGISGDTINLSLTIQE